MACHSTILCELKSKWIRQVFRPTTCEFGRSKQISLCKQVGHVGVEVISQHALLVELQVTTAQFFWWGEILHEKACWAIQGEAALQETSRPSLFVLSHSRAMVVSVCKAKMLSLHTRVKWLFLGQSSIVLEEMKNLRRLSHTTYPVHAAGGSK